MGVIRHERVACAVVPARERAQKRDNTQQIRKREEPREIHEKSSHRTENGLDKEHGTSNTEQLPYTDIQPGAKAIWTAEKRRRKKANRRRREKEMKQSRNAADKEEQQQRDERKRRHEERQQRHEEEYRLKKSQKQKRSRERRKLLSAEYQPLGATLGQTEEQQAKSPEHDLLINGWINPGNNTAEVLQDVFLDSPFERDDSLQPICSDPKTQASDEPQRSYTLSLPDPPREHGNRPQTPTRPPPAEQPCTPTRPPRDLDVLIVTPSRCQPSPQLEHIVSSMAKPSPTSKAAADMLVTLKSRISRINGQIAVFNAHLLRLEVRQAASPDNGVAPKDSNSVPEAKAKRKRKRKTLNKIVATMEKHSNEVFLMEFALRDVVDEGDENLRESLRRTETEFVEKVRRYDAKMHELLRELSPEALEKAWRGIGDDRR